MSGSPAAVSASLYVHRESAREEERHRVSPGSGGRRPPRTRVGSPTCACAARAVQASRVSPCQRQERLACAANSSRATAASSGAPSCEARSGSGESIFSCWIRMGGEAIGISGGDAPARSWRPAQ